MKLKNLLLAATSLVFVACGGGSKTQTLSDGPLSVQCSSEWYSNANPFGQSNGNSLYISKGGSLDDISNLGKCATIMISYDPNSNWTTVYDDPDKEGDLEFTVNGMEWKGTYTSTNATINNLTNPHIMASMYFGGDKSKIDPNSDEVKNILGSITIQ